MLFVLADYKLTSKQIQSLMAKTVDLDCISFFIYLRRCQLARTTTNLTAH
jgi:hypothetical protein